MSTFHLEYPLQDRYIHNWLVAGPQAILVDDLERFQGPDFKLQIARHYYKSISDIFQPPVERDSFQVGDTELTWSYYRCQDDHFVDLSTFYHTCHLLRSWAYTQVVAPSAQEVTMTLTTNGPADVWLNRKHVHRQEHFSQQDPRSVSFQAALQEGSNEILVRFEEVAARECPYVVALQVISTSDDEEWSVRVPTTTERIERRQTLEHLFEQAHLERDIYPPGRVIRLHWIDDLDTQASYCVRLQDWRNRIYIEGIPEAKPSEVVPLGQELRLEEGEYAAVLMPRPEEYYQANVRYQRRIPLRIVHDTYSEEPYGTYAERRRELLGKAIEREGTLYGEIAKFALGRWANVDDDVIQQAIQRISRREDCSDFDLVGLLGLMYRYMNDLTFPQSLKAPLEQCVLGFRYWHDEPGSGAMWFTSENHAILFHTCEILAGQLYPDRVFSNAGQTGLWHREKGERLALEWLRQRGATGFSEWDSNCYFEEDLLALSHLFELAEDTEVRELAAVVMDKLLLTIALNSFKGVFGSTHGRTYAPMVEGGWLEATSGITRLMWGTGVWNQHIRGPVALACSNYELPSLIAAIATDLSQELWNREQHQGVNKVTYRTADYMLSSVQDYRPGEKGYQQHVWQATMGPEAVVFVTHPPCSSAEGAHRPNFWAGNYLLPRVAQWKDTLVAVHQLADDDWLGFTHAYWPVYAFDEHDLHERWAFARKGDAYLALAASQGLALVKRGPSAYRELRSHGQHNTWLCLMGRAASDGSFAQFRQAVLDLELDLHHQGVHGPTLRGDVLSFGWTGPLEVNGETQPLSGFRHYDSPYCSADYPASQMDIQYGEYLLRLHFE
jgi:hypothetical protein